MSCIYLSRQHYSTVASGIACALVNNRDRIGFHNTKSLFGREFGAARNEAIANFVRELQKWNARAYNERYNMPREEPEERGLIKWINAEQDPPNVCQLLKALECIDYQCSDADAWEQSEQSLQLREIADDCRKFLIEGISDYKSAHWAID